MRSAVLAWPARDPRQLSPDIAASIARTPGYGAALKSEGTQPPADLPPALTEPELRLSIARWNALAIDANETALGRLNGETERAARWTIATATAIGVTLIVLGTIHAVALAIEDNPTRTFLVG